MFNKLFKSVLFLWIMVCLGYHAVAATTDELNRVQTSSSSNKQDNHVADDSGLPTGPITSRRRRSNLSPTKDVNIKKTYL
uniref:Uncharacterized protein n=1 Tax=Glossina palpalis gambiensis TaxID=67801 RepID=A0A1B0BSS6_9MUSC